MPVIESARKQARQSLVAQIRNNRFRRRLHDDQKDFYVLAETDVKAAAEKLSGIYKIIDTCVKKHLLHHNTAARMKSKAARAVGGKIA